MENITELIKKSEEIITNREAISKIKLPALKEVIEHVASTKNSHGYYTKHSAHTKSSTKGCVMGCLAG
jgi:hypothetical protein